MMDVMLLSLVFKTDCVQTEARTTTRYLSFFFSVMWKLTASLYIAVVMTNVSDTVILMRALISTPAAQVKILTDCFRIEPRD